MTSDGRTRPVATLNGTLATTRWIVAILENHQQADGSVRVPRGACEALTSDGREVTRTHRQMTPPAPGRHRPGRHHRPHATARSRRGPSTPSPGSSGPGAMLVLVTGRPPRWMTPVAQRGRAPRRGDLRQRRDRLRPAHRAGDLDTQLIDRGGAARRRSRCSRGAARAAASRSSTARVRLLATTTSCSSWDATTAGRRSGWTSSSPRPAAKLLARHPELDADALLAEAAGPGRRPGAAARTPTGSG